jgi:CTP:molybdopterin cytidylyltransferase MocA
MTLLVLAAGMGSRYGGLKQIDPFTEDGEFIIDFSVYDAIKAGFDRRTAAEDLCRRCAYARRFG